MEPRSHIFLKNEQLSTNKHADILPLALQISAVGLLTIKTPPRLRNNAKLLDLQIADYSLSKSENNDWTLSKNVRKPSSLQEISKKHWKRQPLPKRLVKHRS